MARLTNQKLWGECECGKWGEAPAGFNESKHFLKCPSCGLAMYLTIHDPKLVARRDSDKVVITEFIKHGGG